MTYDRMQTKMTWGGAIGTQGEIWQCGVHLALDPSLDGPGLPTNIEAIQLLDDVLSPFHSDATVNIDPGATLTYVKFATLDDEGAYTGEPLVQEQIAVAGGFTSTSRSGPQDAGVVTLWSGFTFGEANYGRFYVPWWQAQVDGNGQVLDAQRDAFLSAAVTMLDGINAWAADVLSADCRIRNMSKVGTGTTKNVVYARAGLVKDTQRRRRNKIAESPDATALA